MSFNGRRYVAAASLAAAVVGLALVPSALWAQTVSSVEVEGQESVSSDRIIATFGLHAGSQYSPEKIRTGVKRLYNLGAFSDIRITSEEKDGVALTIHVIERPVVSSVKFEGNDEIDDEELSAAVEVKPGLNLSPAKIAAGKVAILDLYRDKGYLNATLEEVMDESDDGKRVDVSFSVTEGEKVVVKKIRFEGNDQLGDGDLKKVMKTKEDKWWREGVLRQAVLESDLEKIEQSYRDKGFLDAEVLGWEKELDEEQKNLTITISVEEGLQYTVREVAWTGNTLADSALLQSMNKVVRGEPYNAEGLNKTLENIYGWYAEQGYIYAYVEPVELPYPEGRLDIEFKISEGNAAHVHEIRIAGNNITREKVIRRELKIHPGDLLRRSEIIRSQSDVFNLGFFKDIRIATEPANEQGDINLIFELEEKQTGEAGLGIGYTETNGVTGFISTTQGNLFGRGQHMSVRWEFGKISQDIELSFTEPWLFDTPTSAGFDIYHTERDRDFYDLRRTGGDIRLGRPLPRTKHTKLFWTYRLEDVELRDFDESYEGGLDDEDWPKRTSSTTFTFIRRTTDRPFHATSGTRTSASMEFAGGVLGGSVEFQKHLLDSRWYTRLIWGSALMLRGKVGLIDSYGDLSLVPDYELFQLGGGGIDGIRGYGERDVVPEGNPPWVGGRFMSIWNIEYKVPIVENQIFGLLFFDAGNTWNSFREADFTGLKKGVGFGIRVEVPMLGQLGFDYGYGLDKDDPGWEPHFQFGSVF
jgi:outer membrane protein insertion porin family